MCLNLKLNALESSFSFAEIKKPITITDVFELRLAHIVYGSNAFYS